MSSAGITPPPKTRISGACSSAKKFITSGKTVKCAPERTEIPIAPTLC
jgi:hypothetical protein